MRAHKITLRNPEPAVEALIGALLVLDAQLRKVEADAHSLAQTDRITRGLKLSELAELSGHLTSAVWLAAKALK
jgi:hypothetical protein